MRGYHDEMGGPDSIAGPEWGSLGWGDGVTAAGLPASPSEVAKINGSTHEAMRRGWLIPSASTSPSDEQLRHDYLLRRHIFDPSYGVVPGDGWRERCLSALGVPFVDDAPPVLVARNRRERGRHLPR